MAVVPRGTSHIHLLTPINPPVGGFFVYPLNSAATGAVLRTRFKNCYIGFKNCYEV
jgi:hypothetical protein